MCQAVTFLSFIYEKAQLQSSIRFSSLFFLFFCQWKSKLFPFRRFIINYGFSKRPGKVEKFCRKNLPSPTTTSDVYTIDFGFKVKKRKRGSEKEKKLITDSAWEKGFTSIVQLVLSCWSFFFFLAIIKSFFIQSTSERRRRRETAKKCTRSHVRWTTTISDIDWWSGSSRNSPRWLFADDMKKKT